ncbi:SNF2 family protein [Theileria parva strain Muguga]|uniref:DNA helicase, putative n=1 Tax=Theileria parva TaxID=5875 RepID=Q4N163_THEPA|nr:SNF2 family protein [Theileria parva strain Muguga]EAN32240.1 SNF2 family protein [Theileria parva strain Muguga]|eukprot:XP_764523.1 DNA helicase [Theileria parva strain Muguga]
MSETLGSDSVFSFGKHKGRTFMYVYNNDVGYVNWIRSLPDPSGKLLEFLNFTKQYEMCKSPENTPKDSTQIQQESTKCVSTNYLSGLLSPNIGTVTLESSFSSRKQDITPLKSYNTTNNNTVNKLVANNNVNNLTTKLSDDKNSLNDKSSDILDEIRLDEISKKRKIMENPTPNDVTFSRDKDFESEKSLLSPSLKYMLDILTAEQKKTIDSNTDGDDNINTDNGIEIDGLLALVLYSEDEFYLSYSRNKSQFGFWSCYIPNEVSEIISKMGLTSNVRNLGKERCITYKASDYNTVLKGLRSALKDKNAVEPIPNFVLRVFPSFIPFSRDFNLEEKTRQILSGRQDDYTRENMVNLSKLIGDELWSQLMPFQRQGVYFGLAKNGRVLIGDEMGLGKTLQALAIAAFYNNDWPLLIICPSSLRFQWMDQCLTWLPHLVDEYQILMVMSSKPFTTTESKRKKSKNLFDFDDFDTYYAYNNSNTTVKTKTKSKGMDLELLDMYKVVIISYDLMVRIKELKEFKVVICDESHYLKNKASQRSKRVVPVLKSAKRVILLSGTPALNFPSELFEQISSIIPGFSSSHLFIDRYCKKRTNWFTKRIEYVDSKHTNELHLFLISTVMIRRLKNDVLTQLPPKIRSKIPIEIPEKLVKTTKVMLEKFSSLKSNALFNNLDSDSGSTPDSELGSKRPKIKIGPGKDRIENYYNVVMEHLNSFGDGDEMGYKEGDVKRAHMSLMAKLFQLTGESKTKGVCKYIEEILENQNKFIIFAHHMFMMDAIEDTLRSKKVGYIRIDGSTKMNDRAKLVNLFQNTNESTKHEGKVDKVEDEDSPDYTVRVALLSLTSCGVGLNLTSSSTVIFAELYWVPGVLLQAEDRVHRIGTKFNKININYLIAQNSVEEVMWKVINKKYKTVTSTLDGETGTLSLLTNNKKKNYEQTTLDLQPKK